MQTQEKNNPIDNNVELMYDAIKKGERAKHLTEILMETIGMNYDGDFNELIQKLQKTAEEYGQALEMMNLIFRENLKNRPPEDGVSVSN